jgi:hypothetical protein
VQEEVLRKVFEKLSPGGQLILKEVDTRPVWKYVWHYFQELLYNRERLYCRSYSGFRKLLEDTGFKVSYHRIDKGYPYPHVLYQCDKERQL